MNSVLIICFLVGIFAGYIKNKMEITMIRRVLLMAVAAVWLASCSTGARVEKVESSTFDTASVVQRVKDIYADVFHHYELMDSPDGMRNRLTGIKPPAVKFCTRDWNDWLTRVTSYDAAHVEEGEIGFMEADYWVMGQDWGDLAVSDVRVTAMTDSTATVELNLHNLGSVTALRLNLCHEDGLWKIDNFINVAYDVDWKSNMKEYLSENEKNN